MNFGYKATDRTLEGQATTYISGEQDFSHSYLRFCSVVGTAGGGGDTLTIISALTSFQYSLIDRRSTATCREVFNWIAMGV